MVELIPVDHENDPKIRAMWERGEHTCEMFDAPCMVCVKEEVEVGEDDSDEKARNCKIFGVVVGVFIGISVVYLILP